MKNKIITAVCMIMILLPWTILPLRSFQWALKSPTAEIMIGCYAVFMIFCGIFTAFAYVKAGAQNYFMKICLIINSLYAAGGTVLLGMMVNSQFM